MRLPAKVENLELCLRLNCLAATSLCSCLQLGVTEKRVGDFLQSAGQMGSGKHGAKPCGDLQPVLLPSVLMHPGRETRRNEKLRQEKDRVRGV